MSKFEEFGAQGSVKAFTSGVRVATSEKTAPAHKSLLSKLAMLGVAVAIVGCAAPQEPAPVKPAEVASLSPAVYDSLGKTFDAKLVGNFAGKEVKEAIDSTRNQLLSSGTNPAFVNYYADSMKVDFSNKMTNANYYSAISAGTTQYGGGGLNPALPNLMESSFKKDVQEKVKASQAINQAVVKNSVSR